MRLRKSVRGRGGLVPVLVECKTFKNENSSELSTRFDQTSLAGGYGSEATVLKE